MASMEALMAMRLVEEEISRISLVSTLIWSTLRLFSMAWSSMVMISAVLARTGSVSLWAERSISSARPRISAEYAVMAEHSSAILWVSPWVPAALVLMAEVLPAISSRAAESCSVRPDRSRTLPLEVRVRCRTSWVTPLMRSELS